MLLFSLGCNTKPKQKDEHVQEKTKRNADQLIHPTQQDRVQIIMDINDTLTYSKAAIENIKNNHPEFFQEIPYNPEQAYFKNTEKVTFSSEAGEDIYFNLYAYFLKQKNDDSLFAAQRKKLLAIYSTINFLMAQIQYGGTYFGHQHRRIAAYAEYSIYLLKDKKSSGKTYDITKQKQLYLRSLRQLITDEISIDQSIGGPDKVKRNLELNSLVNDLDKLISNLFYLRRAQEFHYNHYEYY